MQFRQKNLILIATVLLIGLTGRGASAFSLTGDTSSKSIPYNDEIGGEGSVTVREVKLLDPPDENSDIIKMLNNLYAGWTFNFMPSNNGFMVVENSPAYVQFYGAPYNSTVAERIGAKLELNFLQPAGSDFSNFHWIQRVTNFKIYGKKGSDTDFIDVPDYQNNPFYDLQFNPPLTPSLFIDTPYTTNIWQAHTFDAELYVVKLTGTRIVGDKVLGDVTIYNGVSWGWTSTFTPRKASDYPGDDGGCTGDSGGGGCESASISFAAVRQMLLLDSDGANTKINNTDGSINRQLPGASQSPKSVPEPGSIVGLLALGIGSVRSLTKRKSGESE